MEEEDAAKGKGAAFSLGQDLSRLSVDELRELVRRLHGEITRIEAEIAGRDDTRSAADAIFRK